MAVGAARGPVELEDLDCDNVVAEKGEVMQQRRFR